MMDEKKGRPSGYDTRTAMETAAFDRAAISYDDCTTTAAGRQIQIKDFLLIGSENAIPRRHLRQLTGLSDRDLRRRIQPMRGRAREIQAVAAAGEAMGILNGAEKSRRNLGDFSETFCASEG